MRSVWSTVAAIFLVALASDPGHAQVPQAQGVIALAPGELSWQELPGDPEVLMAPLYGNPAEEGHYIIRLKIPPSWTGRPHTHGGLELATFQSGTCYVAYGDDLSREAAKRTGPGSFVAVPAGTKMRGFTGEDGCVVDVQGQGPFTTQYLDEKGDRER